MMKIPRILVACEESGRVTEAFRKNGCEAYSCDILPTSGNHPEWHFKADVLALLNGCFAAQTEAGNTVVIDGQWDAIIAFPPCTYLTNASAVRMRVKGEIQHERYNKMIQGRNFFVQMLNAPADFIAVENPVPMKICQLPKYTQIIQPYYFGHNYSKRTCLWLKNLPPLQKTNVVSEGITPYVNGGSKDANGNYRRATGRNERDPVNRSKTFTGIAEAMGKQWGDYLKKECLVSAVEKGD